MPITSCPGFESMMLYDFYSVYPFVRWMYAFLFVCCERVDQGCFYFKAKPLSVLEFFAVGKTCGALLLGAVKGGGRCQKLIWEDK